MNANTDVDFLKQVKIATPCQARWADMEGDGRARFCLQCEKHVYNLSALTAAEAAALIQAKEGKLCGRFFQRPDGTMLTADCPVGVARHWGRVKRLAGVLVATLVTSFTAMAYARQGEEETNSRQAQARAEIVERLKKFLGLQRPPPMAMGGICALPPALVNRNLPATNSIRPVRMGEVSVRTTPPPASQQATPSVQK